MVRMVGVPHRPDHLRGREAELARLDELLDGNEAAAITPALVGQGGVGKTQLAALYANDRAGRYEGGVFWLTMAEPSASNLLGQLVTFARACDISVDESGDWADPLSGNQRSPLGSSLAERCRYPQNAMDTHYTLLLSNHFYQQA